MTSDRLVSLPHLHEKKEGISIPLSHPFTRPASTALLMIKCIIQKQFWRLDFGKTVVLTHNYSVNIRKMS